MKRFIVDFYIAALGELCNEFHSTLEYEVEDHQGI